MVEAVAEFDYEAQQDDELSLNVGDVIVNIRRDDGGWWEGELGGRRGLFPDNFVREIKKEAKRDGGQGKVDLSNGRASPVSEPATRPAKKAEQIRKRRCKAAFSYVPQHEDELELKIGDIVEIVAEVEEGWWEGVLNGKSGMFPSNFTKEILLDADGPSVDAPASQEEPCACRNSKNSPGSESDGGDSRSETGSGEIQPKKVRGFGFGDIFKEQPIKLRPRSMDIDSEGHKVGEWKTASSAAPDNMKGDPDGRAKVLPGRELCKVLFPYEAQNEDELTIKEGEIIAIITKECADTGWWMGESGGRQGVFPDNFVKLLEAEKERPKKPPPPIAPSAKHATADLDLDAVVPSAEKLSHPTASRPRVTDRRPRSQIITSSSLSSSDADHPAPERAKDDPEAVQSRPVEVLARKGLPVIPVAESKSQPAAKSSPLNPPAGPGHGPASPSSPSPSPELRLSSPAAAPTLEDLRRQLRELRSSVELLKSQHRLEMKQLAGTLDEEKKIRLGLQMEVEHIKKILSK
ncbi:SH3 domain-containing kinase-binding protein 1 isoform X3 [Vanacampus margaritifer]